MTLEASGTVTTDGTEQTLATLTSAKIFIFALDTAAMANGDEIELKIKTKCLTGGTSRIVYCVPYINTQGSPAKFSVPVPSDIEFVATIKRIAGTNRAYPWKVLSI